MWFADSKTLASDIGMIPSEHSSGRRQKLGTMSKEGNALLRYLWCEAVIHAVRQDPELKRFYRRKLVQKGLGKASPDFSPEGVQKYGLEVEKGRFLRHNCVVET
jgi:transposase